MKKFTVVHCARKYSLVYVVLNKCKIPENFCLYSQLVQHFALGLELTTVEADNDMLASWICLDTLNHNDDGSHESQSVGANANQTGIKTPFGHTWRRNDRLGHGHTEPVDGPGRE